MSTISVIIPTYNCGNYIAEAINSILAQTLPANEIIVIDDGSTDDTANIVAAIQDSRIKYFKQSNAGVSTARNLGLSKVTGDFVAFLDADDRWRPSMLEEQTRTLEENPDIAFSFTNFVRFDDATGEFFSDQFTFYPELKEFSSTANSTTLINQDAFCTLVGFGEIPGYTQAIMFKRSAIADLRFNQNLKICEDAEFVLRAATRGKVAFNSNILLDVRRHSANASANISKISLSKLQAFLSVKAFPELNPQQQKALDARLVKAYIDAAVMWLHLGNAKSAAASYFSALRIKGCAQRKIKGLVRLAIETKKFGSNRGKA